MASRSIPSFLIEYFLRGQTREGAFEQFYKDGGITTEVWLDFAKNLDESVRVILAPVDGYSTAELGYALHRSIHRFRAVQGLENRDSPSASPLEDYLVLTVYLDELLHVLLPLTEFFVRNRFDQLAGDPDRGLQPYDDALRREIQRRLGHRLERQASESPPKEIADAVSGAGEADPALVRADHERRRGIVAGAPVAALIGLIAAWEKRLELPEGTPLEQMDPRRGSDAREAFTDWVHRNAPIIADCAVHTLTRPSTLRDEDLATSATAATGSLIDDEDRRRPLIQRVFIDRPARLSHKEAICTIKADAAQLLFEISCKNISWAVIDSGLAADHPAFYDHARAKRLPPGTKPPSRVRGTFDFTLINSIRNFDLAEGEPDSPEETKAIEDVVTALTKLPVRRKQPDSFPKLAREKLKQIAAQLRLKLRPDWNLIEPLITLEPDDGSKLTSDHGTHVAGTLGGDWLDGNGEPVLTGMCPDINLYDLRVIPYPGHSDPTQKGMLFATESAVLAALEFVQHLNSRTMVRTQIIHGVNISMSIPHDVRNYGCGATPICVASDRLVNSGVVVVAAAGNRGWQEQEIGFGHFVMSSITDPGNARHVITVGSTHPSKPHVYGVSYFSSRGPTGDGRIKPDLIAPGEGIRAPIRGNAEGELSGTSMAAPFVSGAAAMVMARHPELIGRPLEVKDALCESATDLERERYFQGHGLVDVLRAIQSR